MKILFITDRYPPHYEGGYEINCAAVAAGMRERGHDTAVLTSMFGVDGPVVQDGVYRVLYSLGKDIGGGLSRRLVHLRNAYQGRANYRLARNVMAEVGPDIAFIWRMGHVSVFPLKAVSDMNIPSVYRLGDRWLQDYIERCVLDPDILKGWYRRVLFGGYLFEDIDFTNMISISRALMRDYMGVGFPEENFTVIPPGTLRDYVTGRDADRPMDAGRPVKLLYAGRLTEDKGVHIGVEAVRILSERLSPRRVTLDIVGSGPEDYIGSLRGRIDGHGLGGDVRIMEQVPHDELMESYAGYDAFLFTSLWEEPFGMTAIESMSRGLPVVASSVGGVPEIISNGRNGFLVPPGDAERLADVVESLVKDSGLARRISEEGVRTVLERYTNDRVFDQTEECLLGAIAKHGG